MVQLIFAGALTAHQRWSVGAHALFIVTMTPPPPTEAPDGLATILGASLGCTSVVMAPVPFLGATFALAGLILSIIGRRSALRGATTFGIWSNAIGLSVGAIVTTWFVWKLLR